MKRMYLEFFCAFLIIALLWAVAVLKGHTLTTPWTASLIYIKDERTKACFAVRDNVHYQFGPYFTYVPCELVDKADWHFYNRQIEAHK